MFKKHATAKIVGVHDHRLRTAGKKLSGFDYEPRDGFLYVAVRACTADVPNMNYDMLPSWELGEPKNAYKTFIGAYSYLNHDNQDPAKARGAIIDAVYHDDPDDKWVECLIEMDESRCPKLCSLIRSGEIDTVSMGCSVSDTDCSVCGNKAEYPYQYCEHIQHKGRMYGDTMAYEICNGVEFFELSWVFVPADPTAYSIVISDGAEALDAPHPYDHRDIELMPDSTPNYGVVSEDELAFF